MSGFAQIYLEVMNTPDLNFEKSIYRNLYNQSDV